MPVTAKCKRGLTAACGVHDMPKIWAIGGPARWIKDLAPFFSAYPQSVHSAVLATCGHLESFTRGTHCDD